MQNDYKSKTFKEWLDKLQQESWQLELIISGFSIYGLSQAYYPLETSFNIAQNEGNVALSIALIIALSACTILLFTLLIHVVLRGLWIGALGLRYVSGDIDYEKLNYKPKFDLYLRRKIGSFDKYISTLEDYCSILFAVSFLLIFYIISIFSCIGAIGIIVYFFIKDHETKNTALYITGIVLITFLILGMLLTFLDFITQGYLKKNKWLSKIYFPFYWVFSYLTLSFLYRPLVHNFLDNKMGKRISLILIPIYFLISTLGSLTFIRSNYLTVSDASTSLIANVFNYDESIIEKDMFINDASIPSKIITTHYLPVFIEFDKKTEDVIFKFNENLKPENDIRGMNSNVFVSTKKQIQKQKRDALQVDYMKALSQIYSLKIDSLEYSNLDFVFTKHNNNQDGFETVLPLKKIADGKHVLRVYIATKTDSTNTKNNIATIPFWYYKE
ncbi:hypothetical protein [Lacinutrix sp. Bg11-31]|uniref:hypothetical protein n=1 Tax=Lacinutrix sp. Bg11-31 TaxID=2057808 RepID=UPI000C2FF817|nr:hypothetical protein [Lacinutrix sp. Bg11-31]AUC83225.1 hypothetical protein CW733_14225 [Lacinutrix sp. Bg11-31]